MTKEQETETKILNAARMEFHQNGYSGARMQAIADRADINKAMLHYYFRSKDQLFQNVFQEAALQLVPLVMNILNEDLPLEEKITKLVHHYLDTLNENRDLPGFVVYEINNNPERFAEFVSQHMDPPQAFIQQLMEAQQQGRIDEGDPRQFMINMIGLCVFPFIAQTMVQTIFQMDDEDFNAFIEERRQRLPQFVMQGMGLS
jgi:TetR/AcrR family transcriptional regulator